MEASFCGSEVGDNKGFHYTRQHLENMGQMLGRTLYDYFYVEIPLQNQSSIAAAAEPKESPIMVKSSFKSTNQVVGGIFSKIKEEISNGNPDFLEAYGSSDSDTSSDEEQLRIISKRKPRTRAKTNFSKGISKIPVSDTPESSPETESTHKIKRDSTSPLKTIAGCKLSNSDSRTVSRHGNINQVIYCF